jgi:hypothetical protein
MDNIMKSTHIVKDTVCDIEVFAGARPIKILGTIEATGQDFSLRVLGDIWRFDLYNEGSFIKHWSYIERFGPASGRAADAISPDDGKMLCLSALYLYLNDYPDCESYHTEGAHKTLGLARSDNADRGWSLFDTATGDLLEHLPSHLDLSKNQDQTLLVSGQLTEGLSILPGQVVDLLAKMTLLNEDQIHSGDIKSGIESYLKETFISFHEIDVWKLLHNAFSLSDMKRVNALLVLMVPNWSCDRRIQHDDGTYSVSLVRASNSGEAVRTPEFRSHTEARSFIFSMIHALDIDEQEKQNCAATGGRASVA